MSGSRVFAFVLVLSGVQGFAAEAPKAKKDAAKVPATAADAAAQRDRKALVDGLNRFALDCYRVLSRKDGNLFFSPYVIHTSLCAVLAGARGDTARQLAAVLRIDLPPERLEAAAGRLLRALKPKAKRGATGADEEKVASDLDRLPYLLSIASSLWVQEGLALRPEFSKSLLEGHGRSLETVDFLKSEEARKRMNSWIAEATHGRITDAIAEDGLVQPVALVLLDAIYFKSFWADEFEEGSTRQAPFHLNRTRKVEVPLMHRAGSYRRLESAVFQAAELPYRDSMLSMVVLLPRGVEGLSRLEKLLDEKTLSGWLESLRQGDGQTDIYLPRFEVRAGLDLMRTLGELGLRLPFDPKRADLSGMLLAPAARPWVSAVHHQSWVRVDERGTEAAAAEVEVVTFAGANKPVVFRVDHPFVFFIRHVDTGAILFLGRVVDPTKS